MAHEVVIVPITLICGSPSSSSISGATELERILERGYNIINSSSTHDAVIYTLSKPTVPWKNIKSQPPIPFFSVILRYENNAKVIGCMDNSQSKITWREIWGKTEIPEPIEWCELI